MPQRKSTDAKSKLSAQTAKVSSKGALQSNDPLPKNAATWMEPPAPKTRGLSGGVSNPTSAGPSIRHANATKTRVKNHIKRGAPLAVPQQKSFKKVAQRHSSFVESIRSRIELLKRERKKQSHTPLIFRLKARRHHTPIYFSWEDVQEVLQERKKEQTRSARPHSKGKAWEGPLPSSNASVKVAPQAVLPTPVVPEPPRAPRVLGAASVMDILGFNPKEGYKRGSPEEEIKRVPKKLLPFYQALVQLRDHVEQELNIHKRESIKKSLTQDLGDVQDLTDGNTETVNRDISLAMVSSNQEMLYEIEEAIKRILADRYGVCEITQKPINKDRLMAVPFTRYSLEGQREVEERRSRIRQEQRSVGLLFSDSPDEDGHYRTDREDSDDD